jgi:hypothetical protein
VKNGLFITTVDLNAKDVLTNGIAKKVIYQISALNIEGQLSCKPLILPIPNCNPFLLFFSYFLIDIYKKITIEPSFYDFIYIRRISPVNYSLIKLLKTIKEKNKECKIVYEVPTYPYDKEHITIKAKINLFIDIIFRVRLRKYVDRITTVSDDDIIFGIPTIKIYNGICCSDIQVRTSGTISQNINIICVAQFMFWHGYERLINGIYQYYKQETSYNVYVHFIGEGPELNSYKNLTQQYCLSGYITFYGSLYGEKLTNIFNLADIAVCSLGAHRIGITLGSFLKSREYLARGLPIISSTIIDILPNDFKYCLYVPEDESPININYVIDYYLNLIKIQSLQEIIDNIRTFAEENCDISKTMRLVTEYFLNDIQKR